MSSTPSLIVLVLKFIIGQVHMGSQILALNTPLYILSLCSPGEFIVYFGDIEYTWVKGRLVVTPQKTHYRYVFSPLFILACKSGS